MTPLIKYLIAFSAWGAAVFGVLQLHSLDLGLGHRICGPWGCGPKMEALLGYHGFWLLLILPIVLLSGRTLSPRRRTTLGKWLLLGGLGLAIIYMIQDGVAYARRNHSLELVVQRALFSIAVAIDFPALQFALAGLGLRSAIFTQNTQHVDGDGLQSSPSHESSDLVL